MAAPQNALVTGAARRLGRAMAVELAAMGSSVAVHYRTSPEEAAETARLVEERGVRATVLHADLALEPEVEALVPRAVEALGPLGLLVNNAALFAYDRPATVTRERWQRQMAVNLRAPFMLSQAFAAQLPEGASGLIVNVVDQRVWNPTPHYTSYTVSKMALWGLTRHLALALAPRIRVNAIGPGLAMRDPGRSEGRYQAMERAMLLGRGSTPEEVARALRFLVESPSITGQMIALDSGQHLGWLLPGLEQALREG